MATSREEAGRALLDGKYNNDGVGAVMDYLSTVAVLVDTGALDRELAFNQFSWWIVRYWLAVKPSIAERRRTDPGVWRTLEKVADQMKDMELRRGVKSTSYDPEEMHRFLELEAGISQKGPSVRKRK